MDKKNKIKTLLSLAINGSIFISTVIIAYLGIIYGASAGQVGTDVRGLGYFKAFTMDSNIICACFAGIVAVCNICSLIKNKVIFPHAVSVLQFVGTVLVSLTLLVVLSFLVPSWIILGKNPMILLSTGDLFFFHLLNPILAIISFVFLSPKHRLAYSGIWYSLVPIALYAAVYASMIFVFKAWEDFYGFTFGGHLWMGGIAVIILHLIAAIIGYFLIKSHNHFVGKH